MLSVAKLCKSCRSRQELSNEYLLFTMSCIYLQIRHRYSRERASQSLPKITSSQKLEKKVRKNIGDDPRLAAHARRCRGLQVCHRERLPNRWIGTARGTPFSRRSPGRPRPRVSPRRGPDPARPGRDVLQPLHRPAGSVRTDWRRSRLGSENTI